MKKLLFVILIFASIPAFADFQTNTYAGAGAIHADVADENATGQMLYGGWSIDERARKGAYRIEIQAAQYNTDLIDVAVAGVHAMPTVLYIPGGGSFYIDFGLSLAEFEALGETAVKGFFSGGIGYRQQIGGFSINAAYIVDDITSIEGFEVDRPERLVVGVDYLF